jgi:Mg-chelatase subunit ChlD
MKMEMSVVPGSIGSVAARANQTLAESLLGAEIMLLIDASGSMTACDSRGGRSRWDVAVEELTKLQAAHPGKIAVVAFSCDVVFAPSGVPRFEGSGTDLAAGLRFILPFDGTVRFIVVSDGCPNDEREALKVAKQFTSRIDTIFVGDESDWSGGAAFLVRLAAASGGQSVKADRAAELAERVETLLLNSR